MSAGILKGKIHCNGSLYFGTCGCVFDKETDWIVEIAEFCQKHKSIATKPRTKRDKDATIEFNFTYDK